MHLGAGGTGLGMTPSCCLRSSWRKVPTTGQGTLVLGLDQTSLRIPLKLVAAGEPRVFLVSDGGNWPLPIAESQAPCTHLDPHPTRKYMQVPGRFLPGLNVSSLPNAS